MSDAQLLERFLDSGEAAWFGALYDRYIPLIYGLCLKYLRNGADAEDAVMQIFEQLMPRMERYTVGEFRTWVHSVTRNHCLQQLRRKKPEMASDFSLAVMESDPMAHLLSKREDERLLEAMEECIEKLPAPQKVSIRLFFLEEKSYADVADSTGYQVKSVKSYIQNGKRNLKICIESNAAD